MVKLGIWDRYGRRTFDLSFGLRIRRAVILSPEVFSTILIIGGVLLLIMTFFDIPKNFDLYSAN